MDPDHLSLEQRVAAARHLPEAPVWSPPVANWIDLLLQRADLPCAALVYLPDSGPRRSYSYQEMSRAVWRCVQLLRHLGVAPGDRVALGFRNQPEVAPVVFACWCLGAAVAPINLGDSAPRREAILRDCRPACVLARADAAVEIRSALAAAGLSAPVAVIGAGTDAAADLFAMPQGEPEDPDWAGLTGAQTLDADALLVYTSGTTGAPKAVVLSQYNVLADADGLADQNRWPDGVRTMCVLPLHHVNGLIVTVVTPFLLKGTAVISERFQADRFWHRLAAERVQFTSVVPTILEYLLDAPADLSELDLSHLAGIVVGAGPLLVDTVQRFEAVFGIPLIHGYGLSEVTCYACGLPHTLPWPERYRWLTEHGFPSFGFPFRHNQLTVLNNQGQPVAPGERGELAIRGRNVMKGYAGRPDANDQVFRHGWFLTGDEGFFLPDSEGRQHFFITGRIKELIIRGGVNISPVEIDEVLRNCPGVFTGIAFGFEHRYLGEEVAAYVVPQPGQEVSPDEVRAFCRTRLPFAKTPKVVVIGSEVPYTSTGKPKRIELARTMREQMAPWRETRFSDRGRTSG